MEFVIIAGVIQIGAIGITSIVSAFRSKSNGWRDLKEDSFDPDFCFRSASRNRKKLRYLCSKSKKGKLSSSQELAPTNEDQANIPGSRAAGTSVRNTPFSQPGRKCKCTILFSDTGGGHRASAQAVVAAFERAYPGRYEFELLDIWRFHSVKPFNTLVETYQFAAKNPWVWELMYVNADFPITRFIFQELGSTFSFKKFQAILEEKAPDLVISVHPLCQNLPLRVLKAMGKGRREIPFVTIVTDLGGAHPTWFDPDADQVYVPSGPVRQMAFRERVAPKQLLQYGLPVRPDFWKEAGDKEELQKKLGMKESIKSVLVVGGGDGVGGLKKVTLAVIKRLSKETEARQAVIVCGSNKKLKKELDDMSFPACLRSGPRFCEQHGRVDGGLRCADHKSWTRDNRRSSHSWDSCNAFKLPSRSRRRKS